MAPLTVTGMSGPVSTLSASSGGAAEPGQQLFTTTGTTSWTVPDGVTSVSAVCVGGCLLYTSDAADE